MHKKDIDNFLPTTVKATAINLLVSYTVSTQIYRTNASEVSEFMDRAMREKSSAYLTL